MSAHHINAFCIDREERWLFAGDKSGQLRTISIDDFKIARTLQAHPGTLQSMTSHPHQNYIGLLGKDRAVSVWSYSREGELTRLFHCSTRICSEIDLPPFHSESQAIAFHPTLPRLLTRSGNGCVLELDYSDPNHIAEVFAIRVFGLKDVVTVTYTNDGKLVLAGSSDGRVAIIEKGRLKIILTVNETQETVHWFEPWRNESFFLASDSRYLSHFNPTGDLTLKKGDPFAKDDMEHVTYNPVSDRLFASSFDRQVYEIDPLSLKTKGIVFKAPFKLRWIKSLKRNPDLLIAQVRDGSLYKHNVAQNRTEAVVKLTPNALWSAARAFNGDLLLAGEGGYAFQLSIQSTNSVTRIPRVQVKKTYLCETDGSYTKRVAASKSSDIAVFGRTNGDILLLEEGKPRTLANVGSAIRDLECFSNKPQLCTVTEAGECLVIDLRDGRILRSFKSETEPLWSLALNEAMGVIAVGERNGKLHILDSERMEIIQSTFCRLPKRMRWFDEKTLLVTHSDKIDKIEFVEGTWSHEPEFFDTNGNTVEDFCWDEERRYFVAFNYNKLITLFDAMTGEKLATTYDSMDYMKGCVFLKKNAGGSDYPTDFVTFGRMGQVRLYRIHDEQLMSMGLMDVSA